MSAFGKMSRLSIGTAMLLAMMPLGPLSAQSDPQAATGAHPSFAGVWEPVFDPAERGKPPVLPELKAAYAPIYARTKQQVGQGKLEIGALCSPPGLAFEIQLPGAIELLAAPSPNMTILYEYQSQAQRIYLDGRPMPTDVDPSANGTSVGHWEGDTLVVETRGFSEFTYFNGQGTPHSPDLSLVTRIRRLDAKTIEFKITATDPKAFAKPYEFTRRFGLVPNGTLIPYECENMRNPTNPDGSLGFTFKSNEEVERDLKANAQPKK